MMEKQTNKRKAYMKAYNKIYRLKHKDDLSIREKIKYQRNRDNKLSYAKSYYQDNREKILIYRKSYRQKVQKRQSDYMKVYYSENRERLLKQRKVYARNYRKDNINARLSSLLRSRIWFVLKKQKVVKSDKTNILLGASVQFVRDYLEKKFQEGMSWDNCNKWHIDHIQPLSLFYLANPEEQKKAFHYTNLQPLWAKDNLVKGTKII